MLTNLKHTEDNPSWGGTKDCYDLIDILKKDLKEARDWIQSHHDEWRTHDPYTMKLRKQFPWLEINDARRN